MEGPITYEEASKVLFNKPNHKSPGTDGYSAEFYKFFWKDLGHLFVKSINYGFSKDCLSVTQREGLITCIPKPNKCKKHIKNWRPITLLNVSYKIATGCIANRLKSILEKIISPDQSGFMSGRFIGDNIRLVYDTLSEAKSSKKRGLLELIDFEKAFDSVAWSFINKTLGYLNFGDSIRRWIRLFNTQIVSRVTVNNGISDPFPIQRGVRQGDPLAPYIFLLASEILAHMIRRNSDIRGYTVNGMDIKISQYADDTTLFLDGSQQSFENCIATLTEFSKYTGLKMNNDKTKIIWFGCPRPPDIQFMTHKQFDWNPRNFKLLGIEFTADLENITEINIQNQMEFIRADLRSWNKRYLTPLGKVTVLKSLILSKIIHILTSLPNPTLRTVEAIENMCMDFIWNGKRNKIKKTIMHQDIHNGGLGMPSIKAFIESLKITWLRRLKSESSSWVRLLNTMIPNIELIFKVGPEITKLSSQVSNNQFWKETLQCIYQYSKKIKITNMGQLDASSFLYNENITIGGQTIKIPQFIQNNINYISQLMRNGITVNAKWDSFIIQ